MMFWFKHRCIQTEPDRSPHAQGMDSHDEKQRRISLLSGEEHKAFEWFRMGYTARWTAETMLLDRRSAKRLFNSLFRKLCVSNEAEVCRLYREAPPLKKDTLPEDDDL